MADSVNLPETPAAGEGEPHAPLGRGKVDQDITCLGCGYNLRALAVEGNCPECGRRVVLSLHGDLLRYADAGWLTRVILGVRIVYWSVVAALATFAFGTIGILAYAMGDASSSPNHGPFSWMAVIMVIASIPSTVLPVAYPIGWWLATTPDPAETQRRSIERMLLRYSALLFFPAEFAWQTHRVLPWNWTGTAVFIEALSHLCFCLVWLHIIMMLRSLRTLLDRCRQPESRRPDRTGSLLAKSIRTAYRLPIGLIALHWFFVALNSARTAPVASMGAIGRIGSGWGSGIGPIIITLIWLSSIGVCHGVLKAVNREKAAALSDAGN